MKEDEDGLYFILSEIPFLNQLDIDIQSKLESKFGVRTLIDFSFCMQEVCTQRI